MHVRIIAVTAEAPVAGPAKQATDDFRAMTVVDLQRALGLLFTNPAATLLPGEKSVVLFNRYAVVAL